MDRAWWRQPSAYKWHSIRRHIRRGWNRAFPRVPLLLRVAPGIWWIALNDAVSDQLFTGFEQNERRFVCRFLTAGMTVLDIGAHAGLYTMTASKLVGPSGCVISFEPSPRERQRLKRHLSLNRCRNVTVQHFALGQEEGEAELFVVDGSETGCNSFRPAAGIAGHPVRVPVRRLDDCLAQGMFTTVDFVKMDIEGAELSALRGAESVFRLARPVLLCELEEARVAPWGYRGREIIDLLSGWRYRWFTVGKNGELADLPVNQEQFNGNYVAIPVERAHEPPTIGSIHIGDHLAASTSASPARSRPVRRSRSRLARRHRRPVPDALCRVGQEALEDRGTRLAQISPSAMCAFAVSNVCRFAYDVHSLKQRSICHRNTVGGVGLAPRYDWRRMRS